MHAPPSNMKGVPAMNTILPMVGSLNDNIIWGLPMVILMIGTGLFLCFITRGVIFTRFRIVMRYTTGTLFRKADKSQPEAGAITPFQAVCTALAATVGTGNIVGVALAISAGGPGAVFWPWWSSRFWRSYCLWLWAALWAGCWTGWRSSSIPEVSV